MPSVGKAADDEVVAVIARRVLRIEEELEGRGALAVNITQNVVLVAIGALAVEAIEERRALVVVWFVAHCAPNASRPIQVNCSRRYQLNVVSLREIATSEIGC